MKKLKNSMLIGLGIVVILSAFKFTDLNTELIKWESKSHDFGVIAKGEPVHQTFYFTNNSQTPIQIIKTKTSCGCTVSQHSEGKIAAGKRGFVKVAYDAKNAGAFSKTLSVYASLNEAPITLRIKGEVQ